MTLEPSLQFWYSRVNYEQRSPTPTDLKLDRMQALLDRLDNPERGLRIVHVAGSKGKGSASAMLATILRCAGYRTGLFTSPHLVRVEERIQIDGEPIGADELAALMADVQACVEKMDGERPADAIGVTFFEIATALGFLYFARRGVDVAVLEVGLGGRFDSTNVCLPLVSIITSISYDHTQQLGNQLASIAFEKAGIVKPGRPTISAARAPEARAVIERICRERASPLRQLETDFQYRYEAGEIGPHLTRLPRVQPITEYHSWPAMELGLLGEHQAANAAVVVATVEQLRTDGLSVSDAAVAEGLAQVQWPARLEIVCRRPLVVLDCAHNVASAQALVDTLRSSLPHYLTPEAVTGVSLRRLLIFAGSSDKDLAGMFQHFAPCFTHAYLTRFGHNPRSVPPEQLAEMWQRISPVPTTVCASAHDAWQRARADARPDDLVCITGSVFLAGELRPTLLKAAADESA